MNEDYGWDYEPAEERITKARRSAAAIELYWRSKGYHGIRTRIEVKKLNTGVVKYDRELVYTVRSNIGPNGFPPKEIV